MSSLKATLLTGPIVRYMASEQLLNPSLASNLMIAVLQAFQVHGQHDANQVGLALRLLLGIPNSRASFAGLADHTGLSDV